MNQRRMASLLAACALVTSCGGSDSSTGQPSGGIPTSAPSPAPSPSPSPTPSYVAFEDIASDAEFDTSCIGYYRPIPGETAVTFTDLTFGAGLSFAYRSATDSYLVAGDGFEYEFGPGDLQPESNEQFDFYSQDFERTLTFGPRDADYARRFVLLSLSGGVPYQVAECILGVPTKADDLPTANRTFVPVYFSGYASLNSVTYDLSASEVSIEYSKDSDTITFRVDAAGVRAGYSEGEPEDPNVYALGRFESTVPADLDGTSFAGGITSPVSSDVTGNFGGSLFGPSGKEVAFVFDFGGPGRSGAPFSASGTVVAISPD